MKLVNYFLAPFLLFAGASSASTRKKKRSSTSPGTNKHFLKLLPAAMALSFNMGGGAEGGGDRLVEGGDRDGQREREEPLHGAPGNSSDSEVESVPSSAGLASATERGIIKGSPSYMSPEQARGNSAELDERSDVFLLGTTLYHIFTFYPPYLGDDIYEIVMKAQNVDTTSPDQMDTGVLQLPEEWCNIIGKAMAPEKADRYQTVEELVTELDALLRGEMIYEHRVFEAGELLMCEGDLGTESYIIANGKVRVVKERNGAAVELGILSDGDIVGEMALITHEPRSATVTAVTRTDVMVLNQDFFNRNLKLLPPWMSKTIVSLAERLNAANTKNLSYK